ncbi:MAG: hypothetical protein KKA84_11385 [Bacteroidetes bacterium]|nr:hypothetical protein [Bacteroidota bacterium]
MCLSKNILFSVFVFLLFFYQNGFSQGAKCDNIEFEWLNENEILITYDLLGEINEKYDVTINLLMAGNTQFRVEVKTATGDFGSGIKAGVNKKVIWKIFEDYKNIVEGAEYLFAVDVGKASGSTWYYYVLGGAAAAVVAILAGGGSGDDGGGTTTPTSGSFPLPPAR